MSDRTAWESEWRALAEKELRGAPFGSLTPTRHDGLRIEPALGPDPAREEGLGDAPNTRASLIVTGRAEDLGLASAVDGAWWRSTEPPPADTRIVIRETPGDPSPVETTSDGSEWSSVVALTDVHENGGSAATEVAVGVAAAIEILRRRTGPPPDLRFAVAVGPELFVEIAKVRALRRLVRRTTRALEVDATTWIAARTALRSVAQLDAPTNVVRATLGVAAAMIGGVDAVGALPMDAALATSTALGARIARNLPLVLARESSLTAVDDPARGSFEIEALTDRIARDAWEIVREIERAGGLVASRASVRARIERDAAARRAAIATRRVPIVGVTKHPREGEIAQATGDARDAAPFEAARALAPASVELVVLGAADAVEACVAFVRELLDVGGFEVAAAGHGQAVVVCAPDAALATDAAAAVRGAAARGVPVVVAGKPGPHEAMLRAAGAAGFVALGQDVLAFFSLLRGRA